MLHASPHSDTVLGGIARPGGNPSTSPLCAKGLMGEPSVCRISIMCTKIGLAASQEQNLSGACWRVWSAVSPSQEDESSKNRYSRQNVSKMKQQSLWQRTREEGHGEPVCRWIRLGEAQGCSHYAPTTRHRADVFCRVSCLCLCSVSLSIWNQRSKLRRAHLGVLMATEAVTELSSSCACRSLRHKCQGGRMAALGLRGAPSTKQNYIHVENRNIMTKPYGL